MPLLSIKPHTRKGYLHVCNRLDVEAVWPPQGVFGLSFALRTTRRAARNQETTAPRDFRKLYETPLFQPLKTMMRQRTMLRQQAYAEIEAKAGKAWDLLTEYLTEQGIELVTEELVAEELVAE